MQIELRNMATGVLSVFDVQGWFSKSKEGGQLVRDIPAREGRKIMVDSKSLANIHLQKKKNS